MNIFNFEQFVYYGTQNGGNIVNGMPWSFNFFGWPVTHETDDRYRICRPFGDIVFNRGDRVVVNGEQLTHFREGEAMTIHAYTETGNYRNYPAYINISENRFMQGQVLVTVRNREFTTPSVIGLERKQLVAMRDAINDYLKG